MFQLFIDLKKAYDLVMSEPLYNILTKFSNALLVTFL